MEIHRNKNRAFLKMIRTISLLFRITNYPGVARSYVFFAITSIMYEGNEDKIKTLFALITLLANSSVSKDVCMKNIPREESFVFLREWACQKIRTLNFWHLM